MAYLVRFSCLPRTVAAAGLALTHRCRSNTQHQTTPNQPYRQPGTLRVAVFLCGAILGVMGRQAVIKLSAAWGGLRKHNPLVEATLNWLNVASPKLIPPADRLAIGGNMI